MSALQRQAKQTTISQPWQAEARRRRSPVRWRAIGKHAVLLLLCLWVLAPIAWVLLMSVKSLQESAQRNIWPKTFISPIYAHYEWVLTAQRTAGPLFQSLKNSVMVTSLTVVAATVTAVLGGYALVHLRTPAAKFFTTLLVASLFFPVQVTAFIGIFSVQQRLGLINQTWSLMLPYTAIMVAVSIFIMRAAFQTVPTEVIDSAKLDGATSLRTLTGIVLPLVRNAVVVVIVVNFSAAWGEYLLALSLMNDQDKRTLAVFMAQSSGGLGALNWPRTAALYVVAVIPSFIIFALAQNWYMKGIQEGALKG